MGTLIPVGPVVKFYAAEPHLASAEVRCLAG